MRGLTISVLGLVACGGGGGDDAGADATNDVSTSDVVVDAAADVVGDASGANDSSDGAAEAEAGPFDVANVPGLVLWLEADVSASITSISFDAGTGVTKWADQTSHKNDATLFASAYPELKPNAIGGKPAVHFYSQPPVSQLNITDNADTSLQWGTGDFFVAVVGDFDNAAFASGNFYSKGTVSTYKGVFFYGNGANAGFLFATGAAPPDYVKTTNAYNDGKAHVFAMRRRGVQIDLIIDGASVATATSTGPNVSQIGSPVRIGADSNAAPLDGDIGEMIAIKGTLSTSDEASIEAYLKAKWGTP